MVDNDTIAFQKRKSGTLWNKINCSLHIWNGMFNGH